ncbi:MAG: DUF6526 family protein [Acidobacteriota bacterium]|nr:DUF6526 family protein [Acidobacteriota bacterium]
MSDQSYKTHRRFVPLYHFVLSLLILAGFIGSLVNLYKSMADPHRYYNAALVTLIFICLLLVFYFERAFALKAQDRAIRAEEHLRHYVLTGSLLDPRITTRQVIGLRFAPDEEVPALAKRAAEEGLSEDAIKRAIKNWRADDYRA